MIYCTTCEKPLEQPVVLYDENTDLTFCGGLCFREWADDNFEKVLAYYREMNVTKMGGD